MPNHLFAFVVCGACALPALLPRASAADDNCLRDSVLAFRTAYGEELETIDARHFMQKFCPDEGARFGLRSAAADAPLIQVGAEEKSALKACAQGDDKYFQQRLRKLPWTLLPKDKALEIIARCQKQGGPPLAVALVSGDEIQVALFYQPRDMEAVQLQTPAAKRWNPPKSVDTVDDSKLDGTSIGGQVTGATYKRNPTARGHLVFSVSTTQGPATVSIVGDELLGAKISASGTPDEFACFAELPGKQRIRLNPANANFRCGTDLADIGDCTQDFMNGRCFAEYGRDLVVKSGANWITLVKDKWDIEPAAGGWRCERNGQALPLALKFTRPANVDSGSYSAKTFLCAGKFTKLEAK